MHPHASVKWAPMVVVSSDATLTIRQAVLDHVPHLARWDRDPDVIACDGAEADADAASAAAYWAEEIAANSHVSCHYVAEVNSRPIGAMQVIDPHLEPSHYWGDIDPNLRAIDIWIGAPEDRNQGHGAAMMRAIIAACFADPAVTAIIIDPLATNTNAIRFYQRLGFRSAGQRRFNDDDCLVHMLTRADWREGD